MATHRQVHSARTARVENLLDDREAESVPSGERVSVTLDRDILLQLLALTKGRPPS